MNNKEKNFFLSSSLKEKVDFCPVVVGKFCSPYGVLGWLKVVSFTEEVHSMMDYQPWFVNVFSRWYCIYLENCKKYYDDFRFIVKCRGIMDRSVAQLLNNHEIFVDSLQFPDLSDGEYYWKDIIGFRVISILGYQFGMVIDLIETGSNDVLVIRNKNKKNVIDAFCLIPFIVNTVIQGVDHSDRVISVDWSPEY